MSWVELTLLSAFAFASADAATKRYFSDADVWDTAVVRFVISGAVMLPWVLSEVTLPKDPAFWIWLGLLVPLDVAALFLYIRAITLAPLSHTLPYLAFAPVFTVLTGWLMLGERVSAIGFAGVALVSLGAYGLNVPAEARRRDPLAPFRFIARETGPRLMLGVALIFSVTASLGKGALAYMPAVQFGPFYALVLAGVTLAIVVPRHGEAFTVVHRRPIGTALVSGAMAVMVVAHFVAVERVEVAYMTGVKRTSMLFGLVYGAVLFRERGLGQNLVAASVMLAGVVLIGTADL